MALNVAVDDVDQLVTMLSESGIEGLDRTPRNSVFISDPDGHRLEILPSNASERVRERQGTGLTVADRGTSSEPVVSPALSPLRASAQPPASVEAQRSILV